MAESGGALTVVIPTCDRPESVCRLVGELRQCDPAPESIVVVDSSVEANAELARDPGVRYIRSRHRNQPYQRFVGCLAVGTPFLVFLDDDLFVEEWGFLGEIEGALGMDGTVGAGVAIEHLPALRPVVGSPRSALDRRFVEAGWGRHRGAPGRIDAVGNTAGPPARDGWVEYLPGAVMAYRTKVALELFDARLFALFEIGLGMGEDKAISMRANRFGKLWWVAKRCLRHPPHQGSHYAASPRRFLTKVLVSRLYLAQVYCEVFGRSGAYAWWAFGVHLLRTLGSGFLREQAEPGAVRGAVADTLRIVARTRLRPERLAPGVDFFADARRDVEGRGGRCGP